jgi:hypothetical protein
MKPFSHIDDIWNGKGFFLNWSLFVMICDKIDIVTKSGSAAPEEKPINPPSNSVSVLLYC